MRCLTILIVLLFLSCGEKDTTTPASTTSGTYSFDFTFKGQKYSWSGAGGLTSAAGARASITLGDLNIALFRDVPNGSLYYPHVSIVIPNIGRGQFEVNETTAKITTQQPSAYILGINLAAANPADNTYASGLSNCKVNVTITETQQGMGGHVKGSFSGTVRNLNGSLEPISGNFDSYRITP